jgi:cytochrome c oxidase assembly protein subunit 11
MSGARFDRRRIGLTAAACVVFIAGMVGMSFAAVPLYAIFCQVTGLGGTTQRADAAPDAVADRSIQVRFDANVGNGLGWSFRPLTRAVQVKMGEVGEAIFVAENRTDRPVTGAAVFNVTPLEVGAYFNKIACFCFSDQTLTPGESTDMPVTFFVDPAMAKDINLKNINTITLSYTFYPSTTPPRPVAAAGAVRTGG